MRKIILAILTFATFAFSAEYYLRTVTDVKEVYKIIIVKKPIDRVETICENDDGSGGSIVGAIIGGIAGAQFGQGSGKLLTTGIGTLLGSKMGESSSKGTKCYDRRITDYTEEEREVFSHYVITIEGGQKFKTQKYYKIGDKARVQMSLD